MKVVFGILVVLLAVSTIGCGDGGGESDSETTFGDPSDAGAPETDEEKTLRLFQAWSAALEVRVSASCDCQVAGGVQTYDDCIADAMTAMPAGLRACQQEVAVANADSEMIAFLECSLQREDVTTMCFLTDSCSDGGASNESISQCYSDSFSDSSCGQFLPDKYEDDFEQECI